MTRNAISRPQRVEGLAVFISAPKLNTQNFVNGGEFSLVEPRNSFAWSTIFTPSQDTNSNHKAVTGVALKTLIHSVARNEHAF